MTTPHSDEAAVLTAAEQRLALIDQIHDQEPQRAAQLLNELDDQQLASTHYPRLAFLINHLLGEKLNQWDLAAHRVSHLVKRSGPQLALLRHWGVAGRWAEDDIQVQQACAALAQHAQVALSVAEQLVNIAAFNFAPNPLAHAAAFCSLTESALTTSASALDASFAAVFNNVTTRLYYESFTHDLTELTSRALAQGADAALAFWLRGGGWQEQERAHYLCAKVALRLGENVAAITAAERGLAIVVAHGNNAIERAFLLQPLAAAVFRNDNRARCRELREEVSLLAKSFDKDTLSALKQDEEELFPARSFEAIQRAMKIAFIGGGNMAAALIGGLRRDGHQGVIQVIEPNEERRQQLVRNYAAEVSAAADTRLAGATLVVLAVKPQQMREACAALLPHLPKEAAVLSIAAGIRTNELNRWLNTACIVRAMPNTPGLIGAGISGATALPQVSVQQRAAAEKVLRAAGEVVWFDDESHLDAVTALSGSGPAYVFYFIEAMQQAGRQFGLTEEQANRLAVSTFTGAAQLAAHASEPVSVLRERVTSKGGTTAAALASMQKDGVSAAIVKALEAARQRAKEMGDEAAQSD